MCIFANPTTGNPFLEKVMKMKRKKMTSFKVVKKLACPLKLAMPGSATQLRLLRDEEKTAPSFFNVAEAVGVAVGVAVGEDSHDQDLQN